MSISLLLLLAVLLSPIRAARAETFGQASTTTIVVERGLTRDNSLVFRFDTKREREPTIVTFKIVGTPGSREPSPSVEVTNDLLSANPDGFLRASRIETTSPTRDGSGTYTFKVNVNLPAELTSRLGAQGSGAAFDGSLKIVAGDATATIPIHVKIRPSPWGPFVLLVFSLVFGALMRWWAETGRSLHGQYDRYRRLLRFHGKGTEAGLQVAHTYLDRWKPAEAKDALDAVEKHGAEANTSDLVVHKVPPKTWKERLLNLIPAAIFLISSFAIATYGFQTIYVGNLTFGAKGLGDWINLVGWGFAAGYTGKTITDYFIGRVGGAAKPLASN
jgi:hypothetical protein